MTFQPNPEDQKLVETAQATLHDLALRTINSQVEMDSAAEWLRNIKAEAKRLTDARFAITRPMDEAKKAVMDLFAPAEKAAADAESCIKKEMLRYSQQVERERQEALRKQREQEEAERRRVAEQERQRKLAEEAQARKDEEERLARLEDERAASAAFFGSPAVADEHRAAADEHQAQAQAILVPEVPEPAPYIPPPAVYVPPPAATKGVSTRKLWKHRVVNATLIPRLFLIPDEKALAALAISQKENANVPGVEFYAEESVAVR